jgi:hypothetical protein
MFWPIVIIFFTPLWVWALVAGVLYTRRWYRRNHPKVKIAPPEKVIREIREGRATSTDDPPGKFAAPPARRLSRRAEPPSDEDARD